MAFLTMAFLRQPVATHANGFCSFEPFSRPHHLPPVATGRERSAPLMLHPAPRPLSRQHADQLATRKNARAAEERATLE